MAILGIYVKFKGGNFFFDFLKWCRIFFNTNYMILLLDTSNPVDGDHERTGSDIQTGHLNLGNSR